MKMRAGVVKSVLVGSVLVVLAGLMLYQISQTPSSPKATKLEKCADLLQGCEIQLDGRTVVVLFSEPPSALKPFVITVKTEGVQAVYANFTMEGMEMGPTKYRLLPIEQNRWQAKVILPVCVAGRRDWKLTLELGQRILLIPFTT